MNFLPKCQTTKLQKFDYALNGTRSLQQHAAQWLDKLDKVLCTNVQDAEFYVMK